MNSLYITLVVLQLLLVLSGAFVLGTRYYDPLDVNRDGVANLVDLSVLAYEINKSN